MSEDLDRSDPLSPTTGEVRSADGTIIRYRRVGHGPAVILLHGAGQSSQNFSRLARDLAGSFTVYVPDRHGRGASGAHAEFHGLRTEIDDLNALLDTSGARYLFGLSAGAVIAIEAARLRPDIVKLALYEPPLSFDGVIHGEWAARYAHELDAGKPGAALATVLKATADRTSLIRFVPRFLIGAPLNVVIERMGDRPAPDGAMSPRELVETVRYDVQTVRDAAGPLERFAELSCEVLLLGGSRSARNLTASLDGLGRVLPGAKRAVIRGAGHTAPDNSRQPDRVAAELLAFFG